MRIKKFTAPTLKEALHVMKQELGPEAIVLETQTRRVGGIFGLGKKALVEITGAIDDQAVGGGHEPVFPGETSTGALYTITSVGARQRSGRAASHQRNTEKHKQSTGGSDNQRRSRSMEAFTPGPGADAVTARPYETALLHELRDDVARTRRTLLELQRAVERIRVPALPETLQDVFLALCAEGVDEQLANTLIQRLRDTLSAAKLLQRETVERQLLRLIAGMIGVVQEEQGTKQAPRVLALVGPTGVGKTTTIVKLATTSKLLAQKKVALISADTYRIGALDQLRTFAAIAQIPLEIVYEPADVAPAMARFQHYDEVFLDTVGRSQRNEGELVMLGAILDAAKPDEIHLTLTPATNDATLYEIADRFSLLRPNRLLVTKLDEATTYGSILNVVQRTGLPVSYLTNGQTVPDDLIAAEPTFISSLIYRQRETYATTATA
jgi:flagellar biosynthesis protein FlhF